MLILSGLRALALSTAALTCAASGVLVAVSAPATQVTTAVPAVAPQATADALARDEALVTSRDADRVQLASAVEARAAFLLSQADEIAQADAALEAQRQAAAAAEAAAAAARKAAADQLAQQQGYAPGTTDPREMARQMMANKYGWGDAQFQCYDNIIMRESRWNPRADNPTSSAYGIPQALPGSRMASEGADWRTNPATQIRWGLKYVKERFGTPCAAWSFKRAHGWY